MPSSFAKKLAAAAEGQYDLYHWYSESDDKLAGQIERYWKDLGLSFQNVSVPWSAVFVSWCVQKAGASPSEFKFSARHSDFVHEAIRNADGQKGVFRAHPVDAYGPQIGDIIHNNREGNEHDYEFAKKNKSYPSHTAIVVETGTDSEGGYAMTIGGNESDSIRKKLVRLKANGMIKQREIEPYISVIQTLK